MDEIVESMILC